MRLKIFKNLVRQHRVREVTSHLTTTWLNYFNCRTSTRSDIVVDKISQPLVSVTHCFWWMIWIETCRDVLTATAWKFFLILMENFDFFIFCVVNTPLISKFLQTLQNSWKITKCMQAFISIIIILRRMITCKRNFPYSLSLTHALTLCSGSWWE